MLLFARDMAHLGGLAAVSIFLICVQTVLIIAFASSADASPYVNFTRALPVGSDVEGDGEWHVVVAAVSVYLYSFCPLFVAVEVAASMHEPERIRHALILSYVFPCVCIYVPTGVAVVHYWGADVPNPITGALGRGAVSGAANAMLLYSTLLDFIVSATTVNEAARNLLGWATRKPAGSGGHAQQAETLERSLTLATLPKWLAITMPALLFALGLALFVPKLDSLVGLLTSLCVPAAMLFGPPSLLLRAYLTRGQRALLQPLAPPTPMSGAEFGADPLLAGLADADSWVTSVEGRQSRNRLEVATVVRAFTCADVAMLLLGIVLGIGLLVAIFAETIWSIAATDYSGEDFWCAAIGE